MMFPEQKSQNWMEVGSNDTYGSKTLCFQRTAKLAHIGRSGVAIIFIFWPYLEEIMDFYVM